MPKIISILIVILLLSSIFAVFPTQVRAAGSPVGYWSFDEGSGGLAYDSSGNENTGTLINGPQWVDGISGTALYFDGIDDWVRIQHSSSLDFVGNQMSIEFWMKLENNWYPGVSSVNPMIFCKGDALCVAAMLGGTGSLRFNLPYLQPYTNSEKTNWDANTWYHIAGVYSGSQIIIYINGEVDTVQPLTGSVPRSTLNVGIGAHCFGGKDFFNGVIDEVAIYDYARSEEQILADYADLGLASSFEDDFETYSVGTFPSAGAWELVYNGVGDAYQVVTDITSNSPTKSLQLWGQNGWSANAQKKFSTNSDIIGYESYLRAESNYGSADNVASIGFWDLDGQAWGKRFAVVYLQEDGYIYSAPLHMGPVSIQIFPYEANRWYKIRTILNRATATYSVWIDDSLVIDSEPIPPSSPDSHQIEALMLASGHANVKAFFDDVKIFEGSDYHRGKLVGYWNFDEGSGTVASDSSGNGNTGTLKNDPQWVTGISGSALGFDGVNDYVAIPDSASLDIAGSQISIEFWMKPTMDMPTSAPNQIIFDKGNAYTACIINSLHPDHPGVLLANLPFYGATESVTSFWTAGEWYHIAITYDGNNMRIYVNGVLETVNPTTGSIASTSYPLSIGSHCLGGKNFFKGIIDEFVLYDYTLSEREIENDYQYSISDEPSSLISLKESYYTDGLPNSLDQLLVGSSFKDIAILGEFHALLDPFHEVQYAEVEVEVDYVTVGQSTINQETKYYPLSLKGNEWVGDVRIETVWPFAAADWLRAFILSAILKDPSYAIEKVGLDVYLPRIITYIGFERIYTAAKVTRIVGKDINGNSFKISLEQALPLKTAYQKMADWATGKDYFFATSMCPVSLSVVDSSGNRVGTKDNTLFEQIKNAYYLGEVGKIQLVFIENPVGDYSIEVEGTDSGDYTIIAGRFVAGKRESVVLANDLPTQKGSKDVYQVSTVPNEQMSPIDVDDNQQGSPDYIPYIILAIAIIIAGILLGFGISKRKK